MFDRRGRSSLCVVLVATILLAVAWLATPRYGPWLSNTLAAPIAIGVVFVCGLRPGFGPTRARIVLEAIACGLVLALLSWWLSPLASQQLPGIGLELTTLYATLNRSPGPTLGAPIVGLSVLTEEVVWRGVLVDWCETRMSPWRVVLVCTLAYTVPMAFSGSLLLVAVALGLGAVLTAQRLYYRTWMPCFVTHLTWNLLVFVVHPLR
jgi:membrane protease YdiL (CAAX protease family)